MLATVAATEGGSGALELAAAAAAASAVRAGTGGSIKGPTAGASGGAAGAELLEDAAAAAPAAAAEAPPKFDTKRARALFSAACLAYSALRFVAAFLCFEAPPSVAPVVLPIAQSKSLAKA